MHHAQQLESVRQIVRATIESHSGQTADEVLEKILIRGGFYCGLCFSSDGYRAVWFIEEGQVKFYAPDGQFLGASATDRGVASDSLRRVA